MLMFLTRYGCVADNGDGSATVTDIVDNNNKVTFCKDGNFHSINSYGPLTEAMGYFCSQTAQRQGVSNSNLKQ